MIGKLTGVIDAVGAEDLILDVQGVGYLVACGARTLSRLPQAGAAASLHIETHVREDAFKLFGFLSEDERAWFVRLQAIQGVGAKVALSILDTLPAADLARAIGDQDKAAFARANGVGPRLAQRIVTELKDKPPPATRYGRPVSSAPAVGPARQGPGGPVELADVDDDTLALRGDAASALMNLGIPDADAHAAVLTALGGFEAPPSVDGLIKAALKELGR